MEKDMNFQRDLSLLLITGETIRKYYKRESWESLQRNIQDRCLPSLDLSSTLCSLGKPLLITGCPPISHSSLASNFDAQQIKALSAKPDNLNSTPRTHMVEVENWLLQDVCAHTPKHKVNEIRFISGIRYFWKKHKHVHSYRHRHTFLPQLC